MERGVWKDLRAAYEKFYREFDIDPETGLSSHSCLSHCRFVGYTRVGSGYEFERGVLFVSLDEGKDPGAAPRFGEDQTEKFVSWRNPHHNGMRVQAAHLLRETESHYERFLDEVGGLHVRAKKLNDYWERPARRELNPLRRAAVTNFYKFVTVGRECNRGDQDRKHRVGGRHGGPEKLLLLEQIRILRPRHLVFQNKRLPEYLEHPDEVRNRFLELVRSRCERGTPTRIWRSWHPAYPRLRSVGRLVEETTEFFVTDQLRQRHSTASGAPA